MGRVKPTIDLTLNRDFDKNKNFFSLSDIDFFKVLNPKEKCPWRIKFSKSNHYRKPWFLKSKKMELFQNSCKRCGTSFNKLPWKKTNMGICKNCVEILKIQQLNDVRNNEILPYSFKIRNILTKKENERIFQK